MKSLGLYIHIPFCKKRCYYCDFVTYAGREEKIDVYMENLLREIDLYSKGSRDYIVDSIFIGGGTPSYIDEIYIERLMEKLEASFNIAGDSEITIEVNPGTLTKGKLETYLSSGINRLSMGVQTLDDKILKKIGRIHTSSEFFENYSLAREIGFENISIDLMFDLPDQTPEILIDTLEKIVALKANHISFYSLIFEEGTRLTKEYKEGKLNIFSEDEERDMYHLGIDFLRKFGYKHYEISNFSRPNYSSRHNIKYWSIEDYLGLGLGAHSLYKGCRFNNYSDFSRYFESLEKGERPFENKETLKIGDEILEYIIMKLRMVEGIDLAYFQARFGKNLVETYKDAIEKNMKKELLIVEDGYLKFTRRGLDISNQVYLDFM